MEIGGRLFQIPEVKSTKASNRRLTCVEQGGQEKQQKQMQKKL